MIACRSTHRLTNRSIDRAIERCIKRPKRPSDRPIDRSTERPTDLPTFGDLIWVHLGISFGSHLGPIEVPFGSLSDPIRVPFGFQSGIPGLRGKSKLAGEGRVWGWPGRIKGQNGTTKRVFEYPKTVFWVAKSSFFFQFHFLERTKVVGYRARSKIPGFEAPFLRLEMKKKREFESCLSRTYQNGGFHWGGKNRFWAPRKTQIRTYRSGRLPRRKLTTDRNGRLPGP